MVWVELMLSQWNENEMLFLYDYNKMYNKMYNDDAVHLMHIEDSSWDNYFVESHWWAYNNQMNLFILFFFIFCFSYFSKWQDWCSGWLKAVGLYESVDVESWNDFYAKRT